MECSTPTIDVNLEPAGFVIDFDSLYAYLAPLRDKGYALVTVLGYLTNPLPVKSSVKRHQEVMCPVISSGRLFSKVARRPERDACCDSTLRKGEHK